MKGSITISRRSDDSICISLRDEASGTRFAEFQMSPSMFAMALTGLAAVEGELTVRGLDQVGKQVERQDRRVVCPLKTYDRSVLTAWLIENGQEDGWVLDSYLGSQRSVTYEGDETVLNYSVRRYVDGSIA